MKLLKMSENCQIFNSELGHNKHGKVMFSWKFSKSQNLSQSKSVHLEYILLQGSNTP